MQDNQPDTEVPKMMITDPNTFAYRLYMLEQEALPRRLHTVELNVAQVQGEVTAIKEITKGIGLKLDTGIERLTTEQTRNQSFVKGVLWVGGLLIGLVALAPALSSLVKWLAS